MAEYVVTNGERLYVVLKCSSLGKVLESSVDLIVYIILVGLLSKNWGSRTSAEASFISFFEKHRRVSVLVPLGFGLFWQKANGTPTTFLCASLRVYSHD